MRYRKCILILALVILPCWIPVRAQESSTSLAPAFQHIITKPGKEFSLELQLTNLGDPQLYSGTVVRVGDPDTQGNFRVIQDPKELITITPEVLNSSTEPELLRSRAEKRIPVQITIPETVPDGEYAYAYIVRTENSFPTPGTITAQLSNGTGVLILITVTRDNLDTKQVRTVLFKGLTPVTIPVPGGLLHLVDRNEPVPFLLSIGNAGKYIVSPTGELTIRKNGEVVDQQVFLPTYVFPDSQRILLASGFDTTLCFKNYPEEYCREDLSYIHPGFKTGFYEAVAEVRYGENAPVVYSHDYFLVIPFGLTIGLTGSCFIAIIASGFYLWHRKKHLVKVHSTHFKKHS